MKLSEYKYNQEINPHLINGGWLKNMTDIVVGIHKNNKSIIYNFNNNNSYTKDEKELIIKEIQNLDKIELKNFLLDLKKKNIKYYNDNYNTINTNWKKSNINKFNNLPKQIQTEILDKLVKYEKIPNFDEFDIEFYVEKNTKNYFIIFYATDYYDKLSINLLFKCPRDFNGILPGNFVKSNWKKNELYLLSPFNKSIKNRVVNFLLNNGDIFLLLKSKY